MGSVRVLTDWPDVVDLEIVKVSQLLVVQREDTLR